MNRGMVSALLLLMGALAGCGSAPLPQETFWRLSLPVAARGDAATASVLRVHDLQLGNALQGDCLVVADGPTRLVLRDHDRWIAPLDRLVTDAVVLGLSRTRLFSLVKTAGDAGPAHAELHGRILEFAEAVDGDRHTARAVVEFWLEKDGEIALRDELAAEVQLDSDGAAGAVEGLSQALAQIVETLAARLPVDDGALARPAR